MKARLEMVVLLAIVGVMVFAGWTGQAQTATVLTRGPYLQLGTPTSIVVRWRTNLATNSRVRYGPAPESLTSEISDPAQTTEHQIFLSGLSPNTRYCYSVGSSSQALAGADQAHCFVTAPTVGATAPVRIWAFGDAGFGDDSQRAVRDAYANFAGERRTDVWLMLGDNAYLTGTEAEYQTNLFDIYSTQLGNTVLWSTFGNHDGMSSSSTLQSGPYYDAFTFPTHGEAGGAPSGTEAFYSFNYANVHFVSLNSEDIPRGSFEPMLTWLREDLTNNTQDWTIVFFHHPPYSKGSHDSDNPADSGGRMKEMRENAIPILDQFGVDLVLTGHSHSYERSFLVAGHYGTSDTLTAVMKKDSGDGRVTNDGEYYRPNNGEADADAGALYAVVGAAGQAAPGAFNHPIMVASYQALGSLVLDVSGLRLEAKYLDTRGVARDHFAIDKSPKPKQRVIADDSEPDQLDGRDHDGAYAISWTYPAFPAQPCGFRLEESRVLFQAFGDSGDEPLTSGANSKWQGDITWTSGPHPGTASIGYWLPYTDSLDTVLTMKTPVAIPADRAAILTFASFEEIEANFDVGLVEASANGGPFQTLATYTGSFNGERSINLGFRGPVADHSVPVDK